jgi:hypothetical protein
MLCNLENPLLLLLKGGWHEQISCLSLVLHVWYSPSGEVHCGWGWDFLKYALSTGQCKLKAVSFMKLNLDIKFIKQCVYYFILHLFNCPYFLFYVSSDHNSITDQIGHMFVWTFLIKKDLGNNLLQ